MVEEIEKRLKLEAARLIEKETLAYDDVRSLADIRNMFKMSEIISKSKLFNDFQENNNLYYSEKEELLNDTVSN